MHVPVFAIVFADLLLAPLVGRSRGHRVIAGPGIARARYVQRLAEIASAGGFTPVIDQTFPFERIVDAHSRVESGRKRGSFVVTLSA